MTQIWTPGALQCRVCSQTFPKHHTGRFLSHVRACVQANEDFIDQLRPSPAPFEGDPELGRFAREEGSVYYRRPGTRKRG